MFTSLLNTVCAYDPVGLGVPYNHLLFNDSIEPLVEAALQILIVTLDHDTTSGNSAENEDVSCDIDSNLCLIINWFLIAEYAGQFIYKLFITNT